MFTLYMQSIMIIIAGGYIKIRKTNFDRNMDTYNEVKLIFIMYHMMLFTDFVPDPETQYRLGYSCSAALIAGTALSMTVLFVSPLKQCKQRLAIRKAKKAERR